MKKLSLTVIGLLLCVITFAQTTKQTVQVDANITTNTTWTADKIYLLKGIIRVTNGVVLTIEPGTVVKGGPAADGSNATCLVIEQGGRINAIGTREKPIIFTSAQPKGQRSYGDWGGIVIFGRAPVNKTNPQYEGGVVPGTYGGADAADSSGTLKYCRIEFAGYPFEQDRELNSLTLCGVGSGTTIEYVQNSYNNDDAFEWFGGTVNANHLIAFRTNDDDWDVDQGYSGNVQFGVSLCDVDVADVSTKNGFEVDNDAGGTTETPKTAAVFSNMTVIGAYTTKADTRSSLHGRGAHLRRNNEISVFNSVIMGWKEGIRMDGTNTFDNFTGGNGNLMNNIIAGSVADLNVAAGVDLTAFTSYINTTANGNRMLAENTDVQLENPYNYSAPDWTPKAGSPVLSGASFTNAKLAGFTTTTYVGAFDQNDTWADDWTEFDPVNAEYDLIISTSVAETVPVLNLSVYPNPASTTLTIEFDLNSSQQVTVEITDITGKVVSSILPATGLNPGVQHLSADVANLNEGVYFVVIKTNNGVKTIKTLVSK